uniref:HDC18297 n=1 Tax=Drosophila melanogaster TaxID=7227 RepID=Q6IIH2_DROME|nr:TPA_inf: HDC18297 [Drosophila melanogaster]
MGTAIPRFSLPIDLINRMQNANAEMSESQLCTSPSKSASFSFSSSSFCLCFSASLSASSFGIGWHTKRMPHEGGRWQDNTHKRVLLGSRFDHHCRTRCTTCGNISVQCACISNGVPCAYVCVCVSVWVSFVSLTVCLMRQRAPHTKQNPKTPQIPIEPSRHTHTPHHPAPPTQQPPTAQRITSPRWAFEQHINGRDTRIHQNRNPSPGIQVPNPHRQMMELEPGACSLSLRSKKRDGGGGVAVAVEVAVVAMEG